jgi:hypothetical protein
MTKSTFRASPKLAMEAPPESFAYTLRAGMPNSFPNMSGRSRSLTAIGAFLRRRSCRKKHYQTAPLRRSCAGPRLARHHARTRTRNFHRCDGRYRRSTPMLKSYRCASSASCLYRRASRPANRRFARAAYTPLNENACATIDRSLSERRSACLPTPVPAD